MDLKKVRQRHFFRLCDLVKMTGISRATLETIERSKNCTVKTAIKIADAMEITLDELCRS